MVWFNTKEKNMPLQTYNEYVKDIISIDKDPPMSNEQKELEQAINLIG